MIYVTGVVLISLCAYGESPINTTHAEFPRNLCPLIKASYGYTVTKKYPYMNAIDIIIGKITCNGKNKIYKLLRSACPRTSKYDKEA